MKQQQTISATYLTSKIAFGDQSFPQQIYKIQCEDINKSHYYMALETGNFIVCIVFGSIIWLTSC